MTLALALVLLLCWVPFLSLPASAAGMYSYNGVLLDRHYSEFNENGKYPYAVLRSSGTSNTYYLNLFSGLWSGLDNDGWLEFDVGVLAKQIKFVGGSSVETSYFSGTIRSLSVSPGPVWASHDVPKIGSDVIYEGTEALPPASVVSVDLSRTPTSCYAGMSIGVSIDVTGTGDFEPDCVLTVTGNTSESTYVELDDRYETPNLYYLYVGADETAEQLTLTAVSWANTEVRATHTVTVMRLPEPEETTPETEPVPDTPEGEEPIPTEENPTEPGEIPGGDDGGDSEKNEAVGEGNTSVDDLTEIIPDYSEGFIQALQNFAGAMSYTGTEAKLKIPAVMFPQLGDLVPGFQMMDEMELDFETYVDMMPENLMTLVRSLFTVALIVFCFKELYGTISYALTLKGGIE